MMTNHYFSKKPQSNSSPKTWKYQLRKREFTFVSDTGVFSKNEVDYGSRLLIEQFTPPSHQGNILDLGCGYGPIGIAIAASFPEREITMVDINERAVELAEQNVKINDIKNAEVFVSNRFEKLQNRSFVAILTNPPIRAGKKTVHAMFEESLASLYTEGELWVVIQKKQGAPSAKKKLAELFSRVEVVTKSKGYYILRAIKV